MATRIWTMALATTGVMMTVLLAPAVTADSEINQTNKMMTFSRLESILDHNNIAIPTDEDFISGICIYFKLGLELSSLGPADITRRSATITLPGYGYDGSKWGFGIYVIIMNRTARCEGITQHNSSNISEA